ncbi:MAG: hypothetical protein N2321_02780 [Melioribacteraceae bacterium]|nr:hypothetical protein [Melioribacteraceae bacterium]
MNLFDSLIYSLTEHIIFFLFLFFILFTIIIILFVKDKTGYFYLGVLKTFLSIIISPIFFLKKTVSEISNNHTTYFNYNINSKQYLLQKFIKLLEVILVISSIAIVVNGIIIGWNSFSPPSELLEKISTLELEINDTQKKLNEVTPEYEKITNFWNSKKDSIINSLTNNKLYQNKNLTEKNEKLFQKISNDQELKYLFENISYYFDRTYYYSYVIEFSKERALNYIESEEISPPANKIDLLKEYINNWAIITTNNLELKNISEDDIRIKIQPNYYNIESEYKSLTNNLQYSQEKLNSYKEKAKYNYKALFLSIFGSFLLSLIFIWLFGLIIELFNISIDIANNVRLLKEHKEKEEPRIS